MKLKRIYTKFSVVDEERGYVLHFESRDGPKWRVWIADTDFDQEITTPSIRDARIWAKVRYMNWLLTTGQK